MLPPRSAPAPRVTATGGAHRDPRAVPVSVRLRRLVTSPELRRLVTSPDLRRLVTSPNLRRLVTSRELRRLVLEPRFALVAAVIAALVLITGKAHDEFGNTADRLPTSSVAAPDTGSSTPRIPADPPAAKPRDRPSAGSRSGVDRAGPPAGQGRVGPAEPGTPTDRPTEGATAAAVPSLGRAGPAGSVRRTGSSGVALTFDDGPDPVNTPRLLELLRQQNVKATFCVVGVRARAHPDLIRQIAAEGHTLCNHSWNHGFELGIGPIEKIREDLDMTNQAIRAAVPQASIRYFRAPGGFFTPRLVSVAQTAGMKSLYWEVDPRDWYHPLLETDEGHVNRIVRIVEEETRPGSMVLSHDFQQPLTITAYEKLIPRLKQRFSLIALPS